MNVEIVVPLVVLFALFIIIAIPRASKDNQTSGFWATLGILGLIVLTCVLLLAAVALLWQLWPQPFGRETVKKILFIAAPLSIGGMLLGFSGADRVKKFSPVLGNILQLIVGLLACLAAIVLGGLIIHG